MEPMMELVNALNSVSKAIDRLSQNKAEKVIESYEPITEPAKEVTLTDVRSVLAEMSRAGHAEQVKLLLQNHGADKLSGIDPTEYSALLKEAKEIG